MTANVKRRPYQQTDPLFEIDRLEYMRPQLARERWKKLSGEWDFAFDDHDVGLRENWQHRDTLDRKIIVPFPYQSKMSGIDDKAVHEVVWYTKDFEVPAGWDKDHWKTQDLLLHFGAVDYESAIYINGEEVHNNEGGHVPFCMNIAPYLKEGKNRVSVRVKDTQDMGQPRGKQSRDGQTHGIWYHNTTGIWQDVWMEPVSKSRINELKIVPSLKERHIDFEIPIRVSALGTKVEIEVFDNGVVVAAGEAIRKAGTAHMRIKFKPEVKVRPWSAESPHLYDVRLRLKDKDNKVLDEVISYTGMRDVDVKNGRYYINDEPTFLNFVLNQGYERDSLLATPSGAFLKQEVERMKDFGFNGFRAHQKPVDPRMLYWADKLGLMAWVEMANAQDYSPKAEKQLVSEWKRVVRRDRNHPSVISWVPGNESWGMPDLNNAKQYAFQERLTDETRALSPLPVNPNDGWEMADNSDACPIHDYAPTKKELVGRYDLKAHRPFGSHAGTSDKKILARDAEYNGQPVIISEWGGFQTESARQQGHALYGVVETNNDLLARIKDLYEGFYSLSFVAGICFTQWKDCDTETNGVVNDSNEAKIKPADFRSMYVSIFNPISMHARDRDFKADRRYVEQVLKSTPANPLAPIQA